MRFISKYGRFSVVIQADVTEAYATGMAKVIQESITAQFEPWQLRPDERELAISTWQFNGLNQMDDEVTMVPPDGRIGLYDSVLDQQAKGFSDEVREQIEKKLISNGVFSADYIRVPTTFQLPPWPNYDSYAGGQAALMRKLVDEGHDLEAVLDYERGTQNRDKVVEGLEELIRNPDGEPAEELEEVLG